MRSGGCSAPEGVSSSRRTTGTGSARSPRREWYPLGNDAFLLEESRVDRVRGTLELTHTYLRAGGQPQTRTILWRAYSVTELAGMLTDGGFREVACYGSLDAGPFAADTRLVLVATAPAA